MFFWSGKNKKDQDQENNSRQSISVSHSSLSTLQECDRKWFYKYVKGWVSLKEDTSSMDYGLLVHTGMAEALRLIAKNNQSQLGTTYEALANAVIEGIEAELVEASQPVDDDTKDEIIAVTLRAAMRFTKNRVPLMYSDLMNMVDSDSLPFIPINLSDILNNPERYRKEGSNSKSNHYHYKELGLIGRSPQELCNLIEDKIGDSDEYNVYYDYPLVELPFLLKEDVGSDITAQWNGRLDAVVYNTETDQIELVDFKTKKYLRGEYPEAYETELFRTQLALYQLLFEVEYGFFIPTVTVYEIVRRLPDVPQVLKNGKKLQKYTTLTTDWDTYRAQIILNGFDEHDPEYQEAKAHLQTSDKFFRAITLSRTAAMVADMVNQIAKPMNRIVDLIGNDEEFSNKDNYPMALNSFNCPRCPFKYACLHEVEGNNIDELEGIYYVTRDELEKMKGNVGNDIYELLEEFEIEST